MRSDPNLKYLTAISGATKIARHAKLIEQAEGKTRFTWYEILGFIAPVGILAYTLFLYPVHSDAVPLNILVVLIFQWNIFRIERRLSAIAELLAEKTTEGK